MHVNNIKEQEVDVDHHGELLVQVSALVDLY
jgi:hypothetical protein